MKLKDKVSVITGAGGGIGRSIGLAFASEGCDIVLTDCAEQQLERVSQEIASTGRETLALTCDISSAPDVKNLAKTIQDKLGRVDILVNTAGISRRSKILEYDDEIWMEVIRINLYGTYLSIKAFLPMMIEAGKGRIINMASIAGKNPAPFNSAYGASKHGVLGLTKSVASEVALMGYPRITVNAICPFYINTEMFSGPQGYIAEMVKITGISKNEAVDKVLNMNLQHRILEPEEVAAMAVYLASEEARGITGQAINICGGRAFH
jgi:NAD(P)-dependent dehydrogenase (short-subunit alcohol dehydrogenase family)